MYTLSIIIKSIFPNFQHNASVMNSLKDIGSD
jgi:hypothetical protein